MAVFVVLGLVVGSGAALARPETYTAQSSLFVGKTLSLTNTAAIPGLSAAASSIAEDYSRLITSTPVVEQAARAVGHSGTDLGGSLSASVLATTPELTVSASAPTPAAAVALANAGSAALVSAVDKLNQTATTQLAALRNTYVQLENQINSDTLQEPVLQSQLDRAEGSGASQATISSLRSQLVALQTQVSVDNLDASTAQQQYSTTYSPLQAEEQVLQVTSKASFATGNRKTSLEIGVIGGLVGGLLVGVTAASAADLRRDRREGLRPPRRPTSTPTA